MTRHHHSLPRGAKTLDHFARRPLYRTVAFWLAASSTGMYAHALNAAPAEPAPVTQAAASSADTLPIPTTGAISQTSVGATPTDTSTTGGDGSALTVTVNGGEVVGSTDGNPTILVSSTGGTGSAGEDGGETPYGGAGGNAGQVWLEMNEGSAVVSGSYANAAVVLSSQGGQGATAGDQNSGTYNAPDAAQPGHGGDSAGILFGQAGSITSTNGWNGSTPGTTAVLMTANGGNAAEPLSDALNTTTSGPSGGVGGQGGTITYKLYEGNVKSNGAAIVALSQGGLGGDGTAADEQLSHGTGGAGGNGGDGGEIQMFIGQAGVASPNITAVGAGSKATGASIPIDTDGSVAQAAMMAAGIQAQSLGGIGGWGGGAQGLAANAGAGGIAGAGGLVQASIQSTNITTSGFAAAGVLAQSIGGAGGTGANAQSLFYSKGGKGGYGGDAAEVDVGIWEPTATIPTGLIMTSGDDSVAVAAQSIGGGGGAGGAVQAASAVGAISLGGNAEQGGASGVVTLYNGYPVRVDGAPAEPGEVIYTAGEHASALVAQSIGGGGGLGGSATNSVVGAFNLAIGGNGGSGGTAGTPGTVQVIGYNSGVVYTGGNHAKGLMAQAISGGGGDGGSATALTINPDNELSVTSSTAVGGTGGTAATSGDVQVSNVGQILTSGSDAWGMLGQSISGGGGNGGTSKSDAYVLSGSADVPSITLNLAIGGSGANGANAGNVTASNTGAILTSGATAHGILAQSISGGGGTAGDSSAGTVAAGGKSISLTLAMGGNGGEGGVGGNVTVDNSASGLIFTAGDSARGILAQSIGGSGGTASAGKTDSWYVSTSGTATAAMSIGGGGGAGSSGGTVGVTNEGDILTIGDSGNGIFAQSIGGGGGAVSAGSAKGDNGIKASRNYTVSGVGGGDANGGAVTIGNTGNIMTFGGDAAAIYAQSIGGGGGAMGAGSTSGNAETTADMATFLLGQSVLATQGYGWSGVTGLAQGAGSSLTMAQLGSLGQAYLNYAAANALVGPGSGQANDTSVTMLLGGGNNDKTSTSAPTPGDGGNVTVTNNANLQTSGPLSAGIWAQSVGGGGGHTGSTATENYQLVHDATYKTNITVGGKNLSLGAGGTVTVNNVDGQITTGGDASFGIFAQSVGAGGGDASTTSDSYTSSDGTPSTLVVGASGGGGNTQGNGGAVNVTMNPSGNAGNRVTSITTSGNDAVGIVAQSIGGGGGTLSLLHTDSTGKGVSDPTVDTTGQQGSFQMGAGDVYTPPPHLGCPGSSQGFFYYQCGDGGAVNVSVTDANITTSGRNAHGILAQSIGGGGAWIIGLTLGAGSPYSSKALMGGSGNDVTVNFDGTLSTTGAGAYGILAQSIGGGGILGGDLASASSNIAFTGLTGGDSNTLWGNAGDVAINVGTNGSITTTGANAHGIFAQSVAGGGGLFATTGGQMLGHVPGTTGDVGTISVDNKGLVQVWGSGASAVFTNTEGNKTPSVTITNEAGAELIGTPAAPVVLLTGTFANDSIGTVNNSGSIWGRNPDNSLASGTAISSASVFAAVNNLAGGKIDGNIQINAGLMLNNVGAYWGTAASSSALVFNSGTLDVNGSAGWAMTPSVINGQLVNSGTIKQSVDFYNGQATTLSINGTAGIGGTLLINPTTLAPYSVTTISTTSPKSLTTTSGLTVQDASNYLFTYGSSLDSTGSMLSVQPTSHMVAQAASLSYNEQLAASNLEQNFDNGSLSPGLSASIAQMNNAVTNATQYAAALDNLSSETSQAASVAHVVASNAFVERMNSCPRFEDGAQDTREHDCVWGRVIASSGDRDAGGNSVGYHQNGNVFQLGAQKEVATDWFVGASASADNSDLDTRSVADSVDGHGWTAGAVVKHQMGDWLVSAGLEGGSMSYESNRRIALTGSTARGQFDVSHWGLHSRISKQFGFQGWYLKPYVDLHATRIDTDGYAERGAGALDLNVSSSHTNVFGASPMIEAGSNFVFGNGMSLQLYGGIGGTFYNQGRLGADMQFADSPAGAGSFHITSDLPNDRLKTTAGMDWKANDHWDVRLEYSGEFASHFESDTGALKVSYKF